MPTAPLSSRDSLARCCNPHPQRPTIEKKNMFVKISSRDKVYTGLAGCFCRPFQKAVSRNMAINQAKPYVAALGAGLAGKPMGAQAQLLGPMCGTYK
jgi:hypothetical protein